MAACPGDLSGGGPDISQEAMAGVNTIIDDLHAIEQEEMNCVFEFTQAGVMVPLWNHCCAKGFFCSDVLALTPQSGQLQIVLVPSHFKHTFVPLLKN
jgi:hypothetical protein